MAMPMCADFRAGASLTPSPVMATISPLALKALTRRSFCSGTTLAKMLTVLNTLLKFRIVHSVQFGSGDETIVWLQTDLPGNILGRSGIVSGDHDDSNACGVTFPNGIRNGRSYRVGQPYQTMEFELKVMLRYQAK